MGLWGSLAILQRSGRCDPGSKYNHESPGSPMFFRAHIVVLHTIISKNISFLSINN